MDMEVDPEVLAALPPDIQKELKDQGLSVAASQNAEEDFLDALPPDIRAEVVAQQQQQQEASLMEAEEEIDSSVFDSLPRDIQEEVRSQQASLRTPTRSGSTGMPLPSQKRQRVKKNASPVKREPVVNGPTASVKRESSDGHFNDSARSLPKKKQHLVLSTPTAAASSSAANIVVKREEPLTLSSAVKTAVKHEISSPRVAAASSSSHASCQGCWNEGGWIWPGRVLCSEEGDTHADEDQEMRKHEEVEEQGQMKQRIFRRSEVIKLGGAHPDWLTEPLAVAQIALPELGIDECVHVPASVVAKQVLSSPQLESVAYAARRFRMTLPSSARAGYYLGDGTGCGKGRVIAALVWHLWNSGARRHLWLSANPDLCVDAERDLRDIGADVPICHLNKCGYGKLETARGLKDGNGLVFASYSSLVAKSSATGGNRLTQLVEWLGGSKACGLIAFDESHLAKNVAGVGGMHGSKSAQCVLDLQKHCPQAAVLYASATGATELRHLGYFERLGLWGPGRAHDSAERLKDALERGGLAAMELLAMTMRAEGMLSCRTLSFKGASFRLVTVQLKDRLNEQYTKACELWQRLLQLHERLLWPEGRRNGVLSSLGRGRGRGRGQKKQSRDVNNGDIDRSRFFQTRRFWSAQQRFFRQLLVSAKVAHAVDLAKSSLIREESVVISMWSTGEARTTAKIEQAETQNEDLLNFVSTPQSMLEQLIDNLFEPLVKQAQQNTVQVNQELADCRELLRQLELPENPLDVLIDELGGPEKVAELTGRAKRLVRGSSGGPLRLEQRMDPASGAENVNIVEQRAFQSGKKKVAIITEAASAGISLHCDKRLPPAAQRPRYMITIELPWEADKAVQQFGRVHRSNQSIPPRYAVLVTELGGECRFVSAIARRLHLLGAMTRGDRLAGSNFGDGLASLDIQNRYGKQALRRFFQLLRTHGDPGVQFPFIGPGKATKSLRWARWEQFCVDAEHALCLVGIRLDTEDSVDDAITFMESKTLNTFLNRILMLEPGIQNAMFDAVITIFLELVKTAKMEGVYDEGPENLTRRYGTCVHASISSKETLYRAPATKSETTYLRLSLDRGISWENAFSTFEERCDGRPEGFYWHTPRHRKNPAREVVLVVAHKLPGDVEEEEETFHFHWPHGLATRNGGERVTRDTLMSDAFQRIPDQERAKAEKAWKEQYIASERQCLHLRRGLSCPAGDTCTLGMRRLSEHVLSGSILGVWAAVGAALERARAPDGGGSKPLPLVRARLIDGGSIVGVRVCPEELTTIRYALQALETSREVQEPEPTHGPEGDSCSGPAAFETLIDVIEQFLKKQPEETAKWNGWSGAHDMLATEGLVGKYSAASMTAVQDAFGALERAGKLEVNTQAGTVAWAKPKGLGWAIPVRKPKAKPKSRRGRGANHA